MKILKLLTKLKILVVAKMKTTKDVYIITEKELWANYNPTEALGLCFLISIHFNTTEGRVLINYLNSNKPIILLSTTVVNKDKFYWPAGDWTSRLAWIEEHIKLNTKT